MFVGYKYLMHLALYRRDISKRLSSIEIIISGFYWIKQSIPNVIKLKRNKDKLIEEYINEKINN